MSKTIGDALELEVLWFGFTVKQWESGRGSKHGTLNGKTAACGAGRLVFPNVMGMPASPYCKKCLKIEEKCKSTS